MPTSYMHMHRCADGTVLIFEALYYTFRSVFGASTEFEAVTWGGRVTSLAFGSFLFFGVCVYQSALTAQMVQKSMLSDVKGTARGETIQPSPLTLTLAPQPHPHPHPHPYPHPHPSPSPSPTSLAQVQQLLGTLIGPIRQVQRVLTWEDRYLTTWIVWLLSSLAVLSLFIPWGWLTHWALRSLGLLLFGPHMCLVGRHLARQEERDLKGELDYHVADGSRKSEIRESHRHRLTREHEARAVCFRGPHRLTQRMHMHMHCPIMCTHSVHEWYVVQVAECTQQSAATLLDSKHIPHSIVWKPTRASYRFKYRSLPDPYRSKAYPLFDLKLPAGKNVASKASKLL